MTLLPGTPAIQDGYLVPSDAPGFGIEGGFAVARRSRGLRLSVTRPQSSSTTKY